MCNFTGNTARLSTISSKIWKKSCTSRTTNNDWTLDKFGDFYPDIFKQLEITHCSNAIRQHTFLTSFSKYKQWLWEIPWISCSSQIWQMPGIFAWKKYHYKRPEQFQNSSKFTKGTVFTNLYSCHWSILGCNKPSYGLQIGSKWCCNSSGHSEPYYQFLSYKKLTIYFHSVTFESKYVYF